jgi:hypothetical protein
MMARGRPLSRIALSEHIRDVPIAVSAAVMCDERNPLEWPSIEQLPRVVCTKINRFLEIADVAALTIQRRQRRQMLNASNASFAGGRHTLHKFAGTNVSLGEKYDGTNVGIMHDGTLVGRRQIISAEATSYQRTDLSGLRALDARGALAELCTIATRAVLYGELCCNGNLYSYATSGIAKSFIAFGALLEFADKETAREFVGTAAAAGLACRVCSERIVRVCNNAAFGDIMRRHRIPVVEVEGFASLAEAVTSRREWMVSERGEGLVLSVARTNQSTSLYKWKISREPQPAAVSELSELLETLRAGANGKAVLLDSRIHAMVEALHAVATHVDSATLVEAAKPAKFPKAAKARTVSVEAKPA